MVLFSILGCFVHHHARDNFTISTSRFWEPQILVFATDRLVRRTRNSRQCDILQGPSALTRRGFCSQEAAAVFWWWSGAWRWHERAANHAESGWGLRHGWYDFNRYDSGRKTQNKARFDSKLKPVFSYANHCLTSHLKTGLSHRWCHPGSGCEIYGGQRWYSVIKTGSKDCC